MYIRTAACVPAYLPRYPPTSLPYLPYIIRQSLPEVSRDVTRKEAPLTHVLEPSLLIDICSSVLGY